MLHNLKNNGDYYNYKIYNLKKLKIQTGEEEKRTIRMQWFKEKSHVRCRYKRNRKQEQKQPMLGQTEPKIELYRQHENTPTCGDSGAKLTVEM